MTADEVWSDLRTLLHEKADPHRAVVEGTGMSFFRTKILRRLATAPCTASELAERVGSDAPYVSLTLRDLEDRGLVRRTQDSTDRRRRIVDLTPEGRALAEQAVQIMRTPPESMYALTDEELDALGNIVRKLLR